MSRRDPGVVTPVSTTTTSHSGRQVNHQEKNVRTVGHRKSRLPQLSGSADLLVEGARFNDEIHRLPTGDRTFIRKGIYRFKTHEDANRHDLERISFGMAQIASERRQ
jgi:hypothetical protein